jgi:phenylpyruvate tautomerase PptA (4-oxalocrotonate tautomerase family)
MIEIYLQEPRVPRLKEIRSIKLATTAKANLAERLTRALRQILAGAQETIPVQLRQGVESVRLSTATENAGGAAAFPP